MARVQWSRTCGRAGGGRAHEVEAVGGPPARAAHEEQPREHVEEERARPPRHSVSGRRSEVHVEDAHRHHNTQRHLLANSTCIREHVVLYTFLYSYTCTVPLLYQQYNSARTQSARTRIEVPCATNAGTFANVKSKDMLNMTWRALYAPLHIRTLPGSRTY